MYVKSKILFEISRNEYKKEENYSYAERYIFEFACAY